MDPCNNLEKTRRHRSSSTIGDGGADMPHEREGTMKEKKLIHRDIERQRRQEMAILFASLRSHIPLQYLKVISTLSSQGKRATSDHVNGAVNFIKDKQTRLKFLTTKRDELKREIGPNKSVPSSQTGSGSRSGSGSLEPPSVMVQPCLSGLEVVVSSSASGLEAWPLSTVLKVLHEEGLEVISSLTARVNERLIIYTIQAEVNSFGCLDLVWLQQKLVEKFVISTTGY